MIFPGSTLFLQIHLLYSSDIVVRPKAEKCSHQILTGCCKNCQFKKKTRTIDAQKDNKVIDNEQKKRETGLNVNFVNDPIVALRNSGFSAF